MLVSARAGDRRMKITLDLDALVADGRLTPTEAARLKTYAARNMKAGR